MDLPKISTDTGHIYIIGGPASGKTHLAGLLSKKLKIKHYDLDDITFETKYSKKRIYLERQKLLEKICANKNWIIEGSYASEWVHAAFSKSDVIIFLDFPLSTIIARLIIREFTKRHGSLRDFLVLLKYALTYKQYVKEGGIFEQYQNKVTRISSKTELDNLLASINI